VRLEKLRAAILPWVFLGFVSTQSQAVNVEAPRQRGASELSVSPALLFWRGRRSGSARSRAQVLQPTADFVCIALRRPATRVKRFNRNGF
jgi:hypothetical protein